MIRSGAADTLKRWAEPLIAVAITGFGLWWALTGFALIRWLGVAVTVLGVALLVLGIRRARFWRGGQGAGHVEVDEGAIAYFGPLGGGVIGANALHSLRLVTRDGARSWELRAPGQDPLQVPVDANGAEALFDVFANLPGIDMRRLLRALDETGPQDVVIWVRNDARLH
ncbi:hypothetical protein E7681_05945 [Thalassobius vesicularis]|uniref:Uncharacterized protein n=1 Tax=Thalassobius vesicularis TaxID=1294297 RepID=A0A4S3MBV1_9RHOB|nr:hypothetical protein [Thalassobius vesicularis]THD75984.1 hypothetical protein E7681_05945 [Thalassobius vesicularis]